MSERPHRFASRSALVLGLMSLATGALKLVSPFRDWYTAQVHGAGLPAPSYALGIVAELVVGTLLLLPIVVPAKRRLLWAAGSLGMAGVMVVAIYVHLQPGVPAEVLPLKIKAPIIPAAVLIAALLTLVDLGRGRAR